MLHCYFDCPPSKERPHCGCHGCLAGFPRPWFFARGGHVPASSSKFKFKGEPAAGIWVATRVAPRPARAVPLSSVTAAPRPHEDRKDADEEEEDEDEEAEEASQEIVEGNERIRKAGSGVRAPSGLGSSSIVVQTQTLASAGAVTALFCEGRLVLAKT